MSDSHANSALFLEPVPLCDRSSPGSKSYNAKNSSRSITNAILHQYIKKDCSDPLKLYSLESDMINQSKETNAALLQRHYLQAAGLFHAQNQQVRLFSINNFPFVLSNTNCLKQYAQICNAVQQQSIKDYHQLQYLAERQRHQELEQIKTKERNQVRKRYRRH